LRLRFLGTGTSFGIPVIGCSCAACTSTDPRDRRTRHGALLFSDSGAAVLVDTPPELRVQLLEARVGRIDAVWFTHGHADHTHGIDDLRVFSARLDHRLPVYADPQCAAFLRRKFDYIFDEFYQPLGGPKVNLQLHEFTDGRAVRVADLDLLPIALPHGDVTVFGFRAGELGYVTDAKEVTPAVRNALAGVRVLVLNALWFGRPHPTHLNIEEAIDTARSIGAEQTYLTHLTHRVTHAELLQKLPSGIAPAYDGLEIEV
jgi:phosphoribosyl 1,2-cyclic phosphate phosphodiesterase